METGSLIAAIVPSALFLLLILYSTVWKGGGFITKVVSTKTPLKIVGVSTKTNADSFIEDDALLWKEFKRVKEKNQIPKEESFSFVLIKSMPKTGETSWDYTIGNIVSDFDNVPVGFKTAEFPAQSYVMISRSFKREIPWIEVTLKIEKYLYEKWLPESNYELNINSAVKSIEYHIKKKGSSIRTIIFYVAIKPKKNL